MDRQTFLLFVHAHPKLIHSVEGIVILLTALLTAYAVYVAYGYELRMTLLMVEISEPEGERE